jgi:predicted esterase
MATSRLPTLRLPLRSDFSPSLTIDIIPPTSPEQQRPSILVLLHGLGDTQVPFTSLGRALNLPNTTVLSLRGPSPLPALITGNDRPSFHWGDDILISSTSDALDQDAGFETASNLVWKDVIADVLLAKCGLRARDVLLWGFGQGAMVALAVAAALPKVEFAGVVAVGGRLPSSVPRIAHPPADVAPVPAAASESPSATNDEEMGRKARTPVLLLGGSASRQVTRSAVDDAKARFVGVEYVKWAKSDDSMPKNREEVVPIMGFLARRLRTDERGGGISEDLEI